MAKKAVEQSETAVSARAVAVRSIIVSWFRENGRDLPWRRTRDPWRILVSEVMLQQIQVKRAIPFYGRFLQRFPTVEALAEAPLAEAIRTWGDLGRYRRVVNLHRTARIVVEEHGGRLPSDPEVLVKFPGIGPYTAGAVACFAFERDVPFYDTNMHRVLHRVFYGPEVPKPRAGPKEILALASDLVPAGDGWAWNQAVMEFGALRCTARKPLCEDCPLQTHCEAHPGMLEVLAGLPRGTKNGRAANYEDSNRYLRGRVLAVLRDADQKEVVLGEIARSVLNEAGEGKLARMREVVASLEADGLARVAAENHHRPPVVPPGAVAEERADYDVGPLPKEDLAALRVSLP